MTGMVRVVPSGDLGLDVLLGGGWRLVKRLDDAESATVVVRGGPGAGKTILGIHVALELARALGGDVVVGCVEILPTEYIAQLESTRPTLASERVIMLSHESTSKPSDEPRIYVGLMLDLDPDQPDLVASLEALQVATAAAGGRPVVFLVDSLIEGYGIGSSSERLHVDAAMKFAAKHGVGMVFCEESTSDAPSPWVFAADTVLQLGVESRERGRWIEVKKHRFGASMTGRHELDLVAIEAMSVFPSAAAWQAPTTIALLATRFFSSSRQALPHLRWNTTKRFGEAPIAAHFAFISSNDPSLAERLAHDLLPSGNERGSDLVIVLDPLATQRDLTTSTRFSYHYVPIADGPRRALRTLVETYLRSFDPRLPSFQRVILGDVGSCIYASNGDEWTEAFRALAIMSVQSGLGRPLILFDGQRPTSVTHRPPLASLADYFCDVESMPSDRTDSAATWERWSGKSAFHGWKRGELAQTLTTTLPELDRSRALKR